jgi:hypothetical protein
MEQELSQLFAAEIIGSNNNGINGTGETGEMELSISASAEGTELDSNHISISFDNFLNVIKKVNNQLKFTDSKVCTKFYKYTITQIYFLEKLLHVFREVLEKSNNGYTVNIKELLDLFQKHQLTIATTSSLLKPSAAHNSNNLPTTVDITSRVCVR